MKPNFPVSPLIASVVRLTYTEKPLFRKRNNDCLAAMYQFGNLVEVIEAEETTVS